MIEYTVEFAYRRSTGPALERFFDGLREHVILGRACPACAIVVVPARDYCDTCGTALGDWRVVGPEGTVRGSTTVAGDDPFTVVRVRLDGAGTDFLHVVQAGKSVSDGARVRPVWAAQPSGTILDIAGFEVIA